MNLSTTRSYKDDTSHATVHQAVQEHDTEITMLVTPPPENKKSSLKNNFNPPMTGFQSYQTPPATTNEIRAVMTSSSSSPESLEQKYSQETTPKDRNEDGTPRHKHKFQQHHVLAELGEFSRVN